jgi:hypothetical protein
MGTLKESDLKARLEIKITIGSDMRIWVGDISIHPIAGLY